MLARKQFAEDKYLLQEKVVPAVYGRIGRILGCFMYAEKTIPVWWDDQTHIFTI